MLKATLTAPCKRWGMGIRHGEATELVHSVAEQDEPLWLTPGHQRTQRKSTLRQELGVSSLCPYFQRSMAECVSWWRAEGLEEGMCSHPVGQGWVMDFVVTAD